MGKKPSLVVLIVSLTPLLLAGIVSLVLYFVG